MTQPQFAYLEKRLNMIEARLIALQTCVVTLAPQWGGCPFSREELALMLEDTLRQTETKLSEFPSPHGEPPGSTLP